MCLKQSDEWHSTPNGKSSGASESSGEANKPEPMDFSFGSSEEELLACFTVQVTFVDWEYLAVIDLGCTQTLVKATLIPSNMGQTTSPTELTCVHGEKRVYP